MRIKKRINHTNRKKIGRDRVTIALKDAGRRFEATLDLKGMRLEDSAPVYVEPYFKHSYMRFPFGTVGNITPPASTELSEIDAGGGVLFRIKVVDETGEVGKVLALADEIRPLTPGENVDREALLFVRERDLGEQIWKLDTDSRDRLELVINNRIPAAANQIRYNPIFQSLILPSVLRAALKHILEQSGEDEDEPDSWISKWLKFAETLVGEVAPASDDADESERWIDDAVSAFCMQHSFCTNLVKKLSAWTE